MICLPVRWKAGEKGGFFAPASYVFFSWGVTPQKTAALRSETLVMTFLNWVLPLHGLHLLLDVCSGEALGFGVEADRLFQEKTCAALPASVEQLLVAFASVVVFLRLMRQRLPAKVKTALGISSSGKPASTIV